MRRALIIAIVVLFSANAALASERMGKLEQLARKRFPTPALTVAEQRLLQAAHDGTIADCTDLGGGVDPEKADGSLEVPEERWPDTRSVRADLIRWLVIDREAREQVDPKGIRILSARITGALDLSFTNAPFFGCFGCRVEQAIDLRYAKITLLSLAGSWTRAVDADGLKLESNLILRSGFHAEGEVRLLGATIGGDLMRQMEHSKIRTETA